MGDVELTRAREWSAGLGTVQDGDGSFMLSSAADSVEVGWAAEEGALVVRGAVSVEPSDVAPAPNAPAFEDLVRGFATTRTGLLTAAVVASGDRHEVRVELPLHEDGMSRHAFLSAVAEVRKALEGARALVEDHRRQRELLAGFEAMSASMLPESEPEPPPATPGPGALPPPP